MAQLLMTAQPGFFDLADSTLVGGQPLTDDTLTKMSHNAKFGAVRHETIYMGYFANGNTVPVPASPVDGYQYSYAECIFDARLVSTRAPAPGFVPGQAAFPSIANTNAAAGTHYANYWDVNDANGQVTIFMAYWDGSTEHNTTDGLVKVYATCQRLSLTLPSGVGGD